MLNGLKSATQDLLSTPDTSPTAIPQEPAKPKQAFTKQQLTSTNFIIPIALRIRVTIAVMSLVMVPWILATWWDLTPLVDAAIHLQICATSQREMPKYQSI